MDRRTFIKTLAGTACACGLSELSPGSRPVSAAAQPPSGRAAPEAFSDSSPGGVREARYYSRLKDREIRCDLCPRQCQVGDRERGYCGVRENRGGTYCTLTYGRPCAVHVDPIEKKPFFHFCPGSTAFSIATAGCNMNCKYCQNWDISQSRPEQVRSMPLGPRECATRARESGALSIAYTYSEPVVFFEYMSDTADQARAQGLRNAMVSAGFIQEVPLKDLLTRLDAVKIDLKAFSDAFYRDVCRGRLDPVLKTLVTVRKAGVWLEIVYLVLPTLNDSEKETRDLCRWIASELGPEVPVHFTRFFPTYLLKNLPPTPVDTLERMHGIAKSEGLLFPYVGNVPGHPAESTSCPGCNTPLVRRSGFNVRIEGLKEGRCGKCGRKVAGLWV
ncbi:MAG: AmmeMemoRadiSam system radical SAM enzyme [bacterium]